LKAPDKQLRVKANLCQGPGVKSKAGTKLIVRTEKHPESWDLVKELNQRIAEGYEIKYGLTLGTCPLCTLKL
jgi:hypothetical protein